MLESAILRKFQSSSRIAMVTEWFRISGDEEEPEDGKLDRAAEVRLLQHLLETQHDTFYRYQLVISSAVKRSIGSTTGFHNHGEGAY